MKIRIALLLASILTFNFGNHIQADTNTSVIDGTLVLSASNQLAAFQRILLCKEEKDEFGVLRLNLDNEMAAYTDAKGRFCFKSVSIGDYVLMHGLKSVFAPNSKDMLRISVKKAGEHLSLSSLKVIKGASVTGILLEIDTFKPIADLQVMICPIKENADGSVDYAMNLSLLAKTDKFGKFQIQAIPSGRYGLMTLLSYLSAYTCTDPNNCFVTMRYEKGKEPFFNVTGKTPVRILIKTANEQLNIGKIGVASEN